MLRVIGFYSFPDNNGKITKVSYQADENGSLYKNVAGSQVPPILFEQLVKPPGNALPPLPPFRPLTTTVPTVPEEINSGAIASLAGGGLG